MNTLRMQKYDMRWLMLIVVLLVVQYVRPQEISFLKFLDMVRPYLILSFVIFGFLVFSGRSVLQFGHVQMRLVWLLVFTFICHIPFATVKGVQITQTRDFFVFFPFMLSTLALVTTVPRLKILTRALVYITLIISARGLYLHDGWHKNAMFNLGSFLSDPNDYSLFMDMMIPIVYFWASYEKRTSRKIIFYITLILAVLGVIASFSRGGLMGLVVSAFIVWLYMPKKTKLYIVGALVAVGILFSPLLASLKSEFGDIDSKATTAQTRIVMWNASWRCFLENPWGLGAGGTRTDVYKYVEHTDVEKSPQERWIGDVSHNLWLTALTEWGILGFVIFLAIIWYNGVDLVVASTLRGEGDDLDFIRCMSRGLLCSMVSFLFTGTFLTVNYYPHFWYLTAIIAATGYIVSTYKSRSHNSYV